MNVREKYDALIRLTKNFPNIKWESSMRFSVQAILQEELRKDLEILEENQLITDFLIDGERKHTSSSSFFSEAIGKTVAVTIELPPPNAEYAIVQHFEDILNYTNFLLEPPKAFFEISSGSDQFPQRYMDAVRFGTFLKQVADHVEKNNGYSTCFLYSGAKLRIPITYNSQDLYELPDLEKFLEHFNVPHHIEKINFFKSSIVKIGIASQAEINTFGYLLKNFSAIQSTFESDFNLYLTDFSLEKILGEIEEKNMKLADKVAASLSDLQKTMVTIPLAIIFAATRIDQQGINTWTNILVLVSVWIFAIFTWCFFSSLKRNLQFVIDEINEQKKNIQEKYAPLACNLLPKFSALENRCNDQKYYRCIIGSLMWITVILLTLIFLFPSFFSHVIAISNNFSSQPHRLFFI